MKFWILEILIEVEIFEIWKIVNQNFINKLSREFLKDKNQIFCLQMQQFNFNTILFNQTQLNLANSRIN